MRILIVEDEDPKLRHILNYLKSSEPSHEISLARSVRSALEALEDDAPDLVILDMSLPTFDIGGDESGGRPQGFGGRELMRTMKLEENITPVIVLTGYDAFNKAGGQIGLDALNKELAEEHPVNFLGMLHFNSAYGDWQTKLRDLLRQVGVGQ
jgi:CheY-like chemotaxis protein